MNECVSRCTMCTCACVCARVHAIKWQRRWLSCDIKKTDQQRPVCQSFGMLSVHHSVGRIFKFLPVQLIMLGARYYYKEGERRTMGGNGSAWVCLYYGRARRGGLHTSLPLLPSMSENGRGVTATLNCSAVMCDVILCFYCIWPLCLSRLLLLA